MRVATVDAHAEGEPLRVILAGFPALDGGTVLDRRRFARETLDHLRRALMWEPRGHADQYGCILTPPVSPGASFGVVFTHNEGYSTMCGHGVIAVVRVVLELGLLPTLEPTTPETLDTPAGPVHATAKVRDGRVESVAFRNVPSWAELDLQVTVPGLGPVPYDLAFGGAFYACVDAGALGLDLVPRAVGRLVDTGMAIKNAVQARARPKHPTEPELGFLYGTIFVGAAADPGHHSRNVCVFAEGEVDRSPTGTGVSGRLAVHHARGELAVGEPMVVESILGTCFTGRVVEEITWGGRATVVPEVEGRAWITGRHEFLIDPADPLRHGFLVR
jgi:trans-L-3-hydroxyproline dehydratase